MSRTLFRRLRSLFAPGLLLAWSLTLCVPALAAEDEGPHEAEFVAAARIGDRLASWVSDLPDRPSSMALFWVNVNAPLAQSFANVLEVEILRGLRSIPIDRVLRCPECRIPMVRVDEDRVVLSKASPDMETFARVAGKMEVASFLVLEVHRTAIAVRAQATLYDASNASVLGATTITVPALSFAGSSVQLLATVGTGRVLSEPALGGTPPLAANLSLLEEVGFAKAGLNIGTIMASSVGTLIYVNPTLAFRGYFGQSGLGWAWTFGAGYGFISEFRGMSARSAIELMMGSTAVLGVEGTYLLPLNGGEKPPLQSYIGIHAGFSLGR